MSLSQWFGWNNTTETSELPEIFPLPILQSSFITVDIVTIFSKILTDVLERTHGLTDEEVALLWDNCVKSNATDGLITLLAKAMSDKKDLFLVYESAVKVIRLADSIETAQIKADYEKQGQSKVGVFISFKNYSRADMVKLYLGLEYCTLAALHKSMNLSKAIQLKMNDMRAGTSLIDSETVKAQAKGIAESLAKGYDVLLDGKDTIENSVPDLTAVSASIDFLMQKLSFYLGLPEAYLSGEQTGGLGTTGENDTRAIERGLKAYYFSIMKPVLDSLFGKKVSYKSQDFRQIAGSMEVLKTFALVDESLLSAENKKKIVNQLLDITGKDAEVEEDVEESLTGGAGGSDIQKQALNGAQVASLMEMVAAVSRGEIPREAAVEMIMLSFQVEKPQAELLLGSAGKGFKATEPKPASPPPAPAPGPKPPNDTL